MYLFKNELLLTLEKPISFFKIKRKRKVTKIKIKNKEKISLRLANLKTEIKKRKN